MGLGNPARLIRDARGVRDNGGRIEGYETRRRREQRECLELV